MSLIRKDEYKDERIRPNLLNNYLSQMVFYLQTLHPDCSREMIEGFVKEKTRERYKPPQVEAVVHPSEGNNKIVSGRLDHYVRDVIGNNNLSPSGSCYVPVSKKESFLRISIDDKVKERNSLKEIYLDYEAQGKKRESQYYNQGQANAKIFNNAIAGGMNVKQFILGSKAGFNAITSTGRISVKQGYSFIERFVNANIYLPTVRDAITYVINHARHMPDNFPTQMDGYQLYVPSVEDVTKYLVTSIENYIRVVDAKPLVDLLNGLSTHQLSYVFYGGCFSNLCRFNESLMKDWIDSCFVSGDIDPSLTDSIELDDISNYADDVKSCILSTNYKRLGKKPDKDEWNRIKDAKQNNPQGLKEFIYCCQYFVDGFHKMIPLLRSILRMETTFSKLTQQHRMARYTVPLSDTDSNIFSTQELIRWKVGKIDFSQKAYEMNALAVFTISQSLEHMFARLSAGLGVEGKDVFRISMKNEFLYPVLIATSLAKHYLAGATMQEGSLLPKIRRDYKGINLRSSSYPKIIKDGFDQFVDNLFTLIQEGNPIRASSILQHVADVEKTIADSISNRQSDYLQTLSVNREEEYADPSISQYFYYELWRDVFAPEMGDMALPNKCFKIPLKGKKPFKDPALLEKIRNEYPSIYERLTVFSANNKREITYLLVPPFRGSLHPLFVEIMDIRSQIAKVMAGYYIVLNALGIGTVNTESCGLVSDFFCPQNPLLESISHDQ